MISVGDALMQSITTDIIIPRQYYDSVTPLPSLAQLELA
jgi:3-isopropylmalate dehydratase small subunit